MDALKVMPPYGNLPIQDRNSAIHVLELLPARPDDRKITCKLYCVDLDTKTTYEPLSYCWGDPEIKETIYCNYVPISITINLYTAMLRFRQRNETRILWVYAVCINQTSIEERQQQVRPQELGLVRSRRR